MKVGFDFKFLISNKRVHCITDRNIVQSKRGMGGNLGVLVYASLPVLRREKSINCSGRGGKEESRERRTELNQAGSLKTTCQISAVNDCSTFRVHVRSFRET